MKVAFLSEMGFEGKISSDHLNMRTEFAWMYALNVTHYNINKINNIKGYDHIILILPIVLIAIIFIILLFNILHK